MLVYFILTNHVRLARLNHLTHVTSQWRSTLVGVLPGVLVLAGVASGGRTGAALGAGWLWLWFVLQVRQWWVPYLFGETALHRDFGWYAAGGYDKTIRILPAREGRPTPDLQHLILQSLTLCAAVATTLVALNPTLSV
jgi:hypothetical protein